MAKAKRQVVPIKDAFSKGLIDGYGRNKVPANFASYIRNARIENQSITVRKGSQTIVEDSGGTYIKGIIGNSTQDKLLVATEGKLKEVDFTNAELDDIGSLSSDRDVTMFNHGKYTIILTGESKPYVYDGTTLTLLTTTAPDVNTIIGVPFSGFTVISGNTSETENFIYFSRPVIPANPERAYDWVGSGSESRNMQSKVLGMTSSLNNLFIFTENTIEYVGKDSLSSIGGTFSFYSSPIGEGDQLLNRKVTVSADDKVFYITKDFTVKTLNYVQGTVDPGIGQLSNRPLLSIKNFLTTQLNENQDTAFGVRKDDIIERHLKSYNSTINDIVLVYDITNDSWLIDDNKFFSCMTKYDNKWYAGSQLNSYIIQDSESYVYDIEAIPFKYDTVTLNFGNPVFIKFFKGWVIAGDINRDAVIQVDTLVDGNIVSTDYIRGVDYTIAGGDGIGGAPIGGEQIGGNIGDQQDQLVPFEKINNQGNVNLKGRNIKLQITSNEPNARFYLDYLAFIITPIGNWELGDTFYI